MIKALRLDNPAKKAAMAIALLVSLTHFLLCRWIAPYANQTFQQWFDLGTVATGNDALVLRLNALLSLPIPTIFFAGHPSYGMLWPWWVMTILNSVIWGIIGYSLFCYLLLFFEKRIQKNKADKQIPLNDQLTIS